MSSIASAKMEISNRLGMHARPAMLLAELAKQYSAAVTVRRLDQDEAVDAKSIMQYGLYLSDAIIVLITKPPHFGNDRVPDISINLEQPSPSSLEHIIKWPRKEMTGVWVAIAINIIPLFSIKRNAI